MAPSDDVVSRGGAENSRRINAWKLSDGRERGLVERIHQVPRLQPVLARYGFDVAVVAHMAELELLEYRDGFGMTLFHVTDDHVRADQLIESKHSAPFDEK